MAAAKYMAPAILILLSGCQVTGGSDNRTIESLDSRKPVLDVKADNKDVATGHKTAIRQYRKFLSTQPDYPLKAEAMRRLIDLEAEGKPVAGRATARASSPAESARLYGRLLKAYPQYPGNDLVLYQLARVYGDAGKQRKALDSLTTLVNQYPQTVYYEEAQFRRGELYFLFQQYDEAEQAYRAVVDRSSINFFYEKAKYMYGWTLYKRQKYTRAIPVMREILDVNVTADGSHPGKEEMVEDCLRVSGLAFLHTGGHKAIARYYNKTGKPVYEWRVYKSLGDIYLQQNRTAEAAAAFRGFTRSNPFHERAPDFQIYVIDAYEKGKAVTQAVSAKADFVKQYGVGSVYWQRLLPEKRPALGKQIKVQLAELANFYHSRAQKSRSAASSRKDYAQAALWYEKHLASFPDDNNLGNVAFLLGESYFELGQYGRSVAIYERSAYDYPVHKKSKPAAYAALLAYEKQIAQSPADSVNRLRQQQIDSAMKYVSRYPSDRRATAVLTKVAKDYYAMGEMKPARNMAIRVLEYKKPRAKSSERLTARTVLAHTYFELGQYAKAETAYARLLRAGRLKSGQKKQYRDRLASSIYKQGEQARESKDYSRAAVLFLRAGKAASDTAIRSVAEYDAAASYASAKQWRKASRILESFQRRYPDHKLQSDVTAKLAFMYTETGNTRKASALYERIARTSKNPELRRDALWKSAEFSEKGRNYSKAIGLYKSYVEKYRKPAETAIEARYKLVKLYGRRNEDGKKAYWQRKLVETESRLGKQRTDRTRYLAAMTSLELAEPDFRKYQQVRLVRPLKVNLRKKKAKMEIALLSYGKAADYGVADVTTASTYKIAQIYQDFGEKLLDSQRPKGLSGLELEQYDVLLEEQAFPFEEKAIETHEINTARVKEGIYNNWVKKSYVQLGKLRPARYGKQERRLEAIYAIH